MLYSTPCIRGEFESRFSAKFRRVWPRAWLACGQASANWS